MPREDRRAAEHLSQEALFRHRGFEPIHVNMVRDLIGTDHIALGTDYPHLLGSIDGSVETIEAMRIPNVEKQRIFSGTAMEILNNM